MQYYVNNNKSRAQHKTVTKNAISFESARKKDRDQTHWCVVFCAMCNNKKKKKLRKSVHVTFARICRIADPYAIRTVNEIQKQQQRPTNK